MASADIHVVDAETTDDEAPRKLNKKGPANTSRRHFTNPVPIQGQDHSRHWEVKCNHCSRCVDVLLNI